MAKRVRSAGVVYRRGQLKARDFTPRPGKDTAGRPGQEPGLSTFETPVAGKQVQRIDLARLKPPLQALADDPEAGGTLGHVAIAPVDEAGQINQQMLEEWAASRDGVTVHPLTQILLDAVIPKGEEEQK